jgi:hypothetical protein
MKRIIDGHFDLVDHMAPGNGTKRRELMEFRKAPDIPMEEEAKRGPVLTTLAALIALLAFSNISKPLSGGRAGFVFLGTKTAGAANAILGPAFGIFLLIYAAGIWRQKRWAVPMAWVYAAYRHGSAARTCERRRLISALPPDRVESVARPRSPRRAR